MKHMCPECGYDMSESEIRKPKEIEIGLESEDDEIAMKDKVLSELDGLFDDDISQKLRSISKRKSSAAY